MMCLSSSALCTMSTKFVLFSATVYFRDVMHEVSGLLHIIIKVKGKKIKFTLEQSTKDERGSRGIALLFLEPRL